MRIFQFFIWSYILFNLLHISLNVRDLGMDYEAKIENTKIGRGGYADFVWYKMNRHRDSAGTMNYYFNTDLAIIQSSDSLGLYYIKNGKQIYGFYNTNLGTRLAIDKSDYIFLSRTGELGIIIYRLVYIAIGFLVLLFIRNVRKKKMFARSTLILLQIIGVVTLVFGLITYIKNVLAMFILKQFCGINMTIITGDNVHVIMPFYILIGLFILIIAFCFGRGNYLEKQNDLTI